MSFSSDLLFNKMLKNGQTYCMLHTLICTGDGCDLISYEVQALLTK